MSGYNTASYNNNIVTEIKIFSGIPYIKTVVSMADLTIV